MMSDEASCDEGCVIQDVDKLDAWRERVGRQLYADAEVARTAKFFEVIRPAWRAKDVSDQLISETVTHTANGHVAERCMPRVIRDLLGKTAWCGAAADRSSDQDGAHLRQRPIEDSVHVGQRQGML